MENLCRLCKENPIFIRKRKLCRDCYYDWYRGCSKTPKKHPGFLQKAQLPLIQHYREIEFIKIFFNHKDWLYHPVIFRADNFRYEPDFYDKKRDIFIEMVGTKQAFANNRKKYEKLMELFPRLKFEIRKVDGALLDINDRQTWPKD